MVRDLIGLFFMPLDVPAPRLEFAQIGKQCLELGGGEHRVSRMLVEIVEEPAFPWQQTPHPHRRTSKYRRAIIALPAREPQAGAA